MLMLMDRRNNRLKSEIANGKNAVHLQMSLKTLYYISLKML